MIKNVTRLPVLALDFSPITAHQIISLWWLVSPRFLCRPTTLYIIARAVGRQSAIYTKTADLPHQLWVGTFPRFVAIGFY